MIILHIKETDSERHLTNSLETLRFARTSRAASSQLEEINIPLHRYIQIQVLAFKLLDCHSNNVPLEAGPGILILVAASLPLGPG